MVFSKKQKQKQKVVGHNKNTNKNKQTHLNTLTCLPFLLPETPPPTRQCLLVVVQCNCLLGHVMLVHKSRGYIETNDLVSWFATRNYLFHSYKLMLANTLLDKLHADFAF